MRVAIIHDHLNQYGGGERVLSVLCEIFPQAHIFTLVYDEYLTGGAFKTKRIHTSFIQNIPLAKRNHRLLPMLMPLAVEQFDLSGFDLVISNSASFAKGVITKPYAKHISYCLTPARFLWDDSHKYLHDFYGSKVFRQSRWLNADIVSWLAPVFLNYLRIWDQQASYRVDQFVAISEFVRQRIKKYYKKDSRVVYPPVDTKRFKISKEIDDYFLMVGRLVPYKRFDLAIEAFNRLGWPLKIVGDGPQKIQLKKKAKDNIEFTGLVSDEKLKNFYTHCRAFIFPQEEDFGIAPAEAMSAGRPVIAYRAGGVLEIIKEGTTGLFFDKQTPECLIETLKKFRSSDFDSQTIRQHALQFNEEVFKNKIRDFINKIPNI